MRRGKIKRIDGLAIPSGKVIKQIASSTDNKACYKEERKVDRHERFALEANQLWSIKKVAVVLVTVRSLGIVS